MMINKNQFSIANDKKVLHKIGKKWVTVSALTLALLGASTVATKVSHASEVQNNQNSNQIKGNTITSAGDAVQSGNVRVASQGIRPAVQQSAVQSARPVMQSNARLNQVRSASVIPKSNVQRPVQSLSQTPKVSSSSAQGRVNNIQKSAQALHNNIMNNMPKVNTTVSKVQKPYAPSAPIKPVQQSKSANKLNLNQPKATDVKLNQPKVNNSLKLDVNNKVNKQNNKVDIDDDKAKIRAIAKQPHNKGIKKLLGGAQQVTETIQFHDIYSDIDGLGNTVLSPTSVSGTVGTLENVGVPKQWGLVDNNGKLIGSDGDSDMFMLKNGTQTFNVVPRYAGMSFKYNKNTNSVEFTGGVANKDLNTYDGLANDSRIGHGNVYAFTIDSDVNFSHLTNMDNMFKDVDVLSITIPSSNIKLYGNTGLSSMYKQLPDSNYTLATPNEFSQGNIGTFVNNANPKENVSFTDIYSDIDGMNSNQLFNSGSGAWAYVNAQGKNVATPMTNSQGKVMIAPVYDGLTYKYDAKNQTLEFTDGKIDVSDTGDFLSTMGAPFGYQSHKTGTTTNIHIGTLLNSVKFDSDVDTSKVTNMSGMFGGSSDLQTLDLGSNFDTSNVTNMNSMFYNDPNLQSLNLGNKFNTSKVTDMGYMFYQTTLWSLDLGNHFNTSNVTNMSNMFMNDVNLQSLNLGSHFNTSNVTNMSDMFDWDTILQSLNLGNNFDTSKVTDMSGMFNGDNNLQSIIVGSPKTKISDRGGNTDIPTMYKQLPKQDANDDNYTSTTPNDFSQGNVGAFAQPENPEPGTTATDNISFHDIYSNIDRVTAPSDTTETGKPNSNYNVTAPQGWAFVDNNGHIVSNPTYTYGAGNHTLNVAPVYDGLVYKYDKKNHALEFTDGKINVSDTIGFLNVPQFGGKYKPFFNMSYNDTLKSIKFDSNVDTSNVTSMVGMFWNDKALQLLNLGNQFNTNSVTNMSCMFDNDISLQSLDMSYFNTSSVTDMSCMFDNDSALQSLDLGNHFDTSNVTNMAEMFSGDSALQSLNLGNHFDTSKVTVMDSMFNSDFNLRQINIGNSDTKFNISVQLGNIWRKYSNYTPGITKGTDLNNYTSVALDNNQSHVGDWIINKPVNDTISFHDIYGNIDGFTNPSDISKNGLSTNNYTVTAPSNWAFVDNNGDIISNPSFTYLSGNHTLNVAPVWNGLVYKYNKATDDVEVTNGIAGSSFGTIPSSISNAKSIKFDNNIDTSHVINMSNMFNGDSSLQSIDFGNKFDTSKVTNMGGIFAGDNHLDKIIVDSHNTVIPKESKEASLKHIGSTFWVPGINAENPTLSRDVSRGFSRHARRYVVPKICNAIASVYNQCLSKIPSDSTRAQVSQTLSKVNTIGKILQQMRQGLTYRQFIHKLSSKYHIVPIFYLRLLRNSYLANTPTEDIVLANTRTKDVARGGFRKFANYKTVMVTTGTAPTYVPTMYKQDANDNYTALTSNDFSKGNVGTFVRPENIPVDTVNYQYNGKTLATQQFNGDAQHYNGNDYNNLDVTSTNDSSIPNGYHLANTDNNIPFNTGTYNIAIAPNISSVSATVVPLNSDLAKASASNAQASQSAENANSYANHDLLDIVSASDSTDYNSVSAEMQSASNDQTLAKNYISDAVSASNAGNGSAVTTDLASVSAENNRINTELSSANADLDKMQEVERQNYVQASPVIVRYVDIHHGDQVSTAYGNDKFGNPIIGTQNLGVIGHVGSIKLGIKGNHDANNVKDLLQIPVGYHLVNNSTNKYAKVNDSIVRVILKRLTDKSGNVRPMILTMTFSGFRHTAPKKPARPVRVNHAKSSSVAPKSNVASSASVASSSSASVSSAPSASSSADSQSVASSAPSASSHDNSIHSLNAQIKSLEATVTPNRLKSTKAVARNSKQVAVPKMNRNRGNNHAFKYENRPAVHNNSTEPVVQTVKSSAEPSIQSSSSVTVPEMSSVQQQPSELPQTSEEQNSVAGIMSVLLLLSSLSLAGVDLDRKHN